MRLISGQHYGVIYLFGLGTCYSLLLLFRKRDYSSDDFLAGVTFVNGILFTILLIFANSLLFLTILLIYLLLSKSVNGVNFSFALISLVSARIINWKKTRLQIKTDLLRNLYLIEGFFMVLYALFHAVPKQFITISWAIAALLYFLLSFILKNVKYRYLALGTMICAAFYFFIVDLAQIELIYRVLALLFLSAISIGISMYYTNRIRKSDN
jgi:hypothetical protein